MTILKFDRGTILIEGQARTPYGKWDPRVGYFRSSALNYPDIILEILEFGVKWHGIDPYSAKIFKNEPQTDS